MSVEDSIKAIRLEQTNSALEMRNTALTTFLRNVATSLEEGEDPEKVADDIHDALGEGRPNKTESD